MKNIPKQEAQPKPLPQKKQQTIQTQSVKAGVQPLVIMSKPDKSIVVPHYHLTNFSGEDGSE